MDRGIAPRVLAFPGGVPTSLRFTPDGRWLLSAFNNGVVRACPMRAGDELRTILQAGGLWRNVVAVQPSGRQAAVGLGLGRLMLVDLENGRSRSLAGFSSRSPIGAVAFGDNGRLLAAAPSIGPREEKVIRVYALDSNSVRTFGPLPGTGDGQQGGVRTLAFVGSERVVALVEGAGLVSVDLRSGASRIVAAQPNARFQMGPDGQSGVGLHAPEPTGTSMSILRFSMKAGTQAVPGSYENPTELALDPTGALVATGGVDGTVRVGRLAGGGHRGPVRALAFSPDGRWLASASADETIRIWPVPDVARTPLHKLPYEELLSRLRAYTNLRVVPDESATGYALKPGAFPGWAAPPH